MAEDAIESRAADAELVRGAELVAMIEVEDMQNVIEDYGVKVGDVVRVHRAFRVLDSCGL